MTDLTHYIRFSYPDGTPSEISIAASYLLRAVHHDSLEGAPLPIGLPADRTNPRSFGDALIVYGDEATLSALSFRSKAKDTAKTYGIDMGPVTPVPSDARHATFSRRRDRYRTQATNDRLNARRDRKIAERLAKDPTSVQTKEIVMSSGSGGPRHVDCPFFTTFSRPGETRSGFRIYVQQTDTDGPSGGTFNTYGLSQDGATVPLVS